MALSRQLFEQLSLTNTALKLHGKCIPTAPSSSYYFCFIAFTACPIIIVWASIVCGCVGHWTGCGGFRWNGSMLGEGGKPTVNKKEAVSLFLWITRFQNFVMELFLYIPPTPTSPPYFRHNVTTAIQGKRRDNSENRRRLDFSRNYIEKYQSEMRWAKPAHGPAALQHSEIGSWKHSATETKHPKTDCHLCIPTL